MELILAAALSAIAVAAAISGYNFLFTQTKSGIIRGNLDLQIDYALEKILLQCQSASAVDDGSLFSFGDYTHTPKDSFCITGERDPYDINRYNSDNKKKYCYKKVDNDLVLAESDTSGDNEVVEVLIDSLYEPLISFKRKNDSEPDYLTVAITATAKSITGQDKQIVGEEGIHFWYAEIIR